MEEWRDQMVRYINDKWLHAPKVILRLVHGKEQWTDQVARYIRKGNGDRLHAAEVIQ